MKTKMKKVLFVAMCLFVLASCSQKPAADAVEVQDSLVVDTLVVDTTVVDTLN